MLEMIDQKEKSERRIKRQAFSSACLYTSLALCFSSKLLFEPRTIFHLLNPVEAKGDSVSVKHRHGRQYALLFNKLYHSHGLFVVLLGLNLLPEVAENTKLERQLNLEVKSEVYLFRIR